MTIHTGNVFTSGPDAPITDPDGDVLRVKQYGGSNSLRFPDAANPATFADWLVPWNAVSGMRFRLAADGSYEFDDTGIDTFQGPRTVAVDIEVTDDKAADQTADPATDLTFSFKLNLTGTLPANQAPIGPAERSVTV